MDIPTVEYCVVLGFLFVLGSIIGSALNVCIHRLPQSERLVPALKSLFYPPSHCPRCQRRIPFYDNIPIVGWLLLGGRCRGCRGRISIRYPLVELFTALLFVIVYRFEIPDWWAGPMAGSLYHIYGPIGDPGSTWMSPIAILHWRYAFHMALVIGLVIATFIDIDLRIIPDAATLPAMLVGLLGSTLIGQTYVVPLWYQTLGMRSGLALELQRYWYTAHPQATSLPGWLAWTDFVGVPPWMGANPHLHGFLLSLAGIIVGGGIVWGVRLAGHWGLKREAMGFGDVVFLAMIGSFLGWQASLLIFFSASLYALLGVLVCLIVRFDREIAFGPYLSLATVILLVAWRWIWPVAETVLSLGPFLPVAGVLLLVSLFAMLQLMRRVMRLFGFEYHEPEPVWEWTSGDQLTHLAGECVDDRQGQWPRNTWRGTLTGRGLAQHHDWRGKS